MFTGQPRKHTKQGGYGKEADNPERDRSAPVEEQDSRRYKANEWEHIKTAAYDMPNAVADKVKEKGIGAEQGKQGENKQEKTQGGPYFPSDEPAALFGCLLRRSSGCCLSCGHKDYLGLLVMW
jgi:hypothetical protein